MTSIPLAEELLLLAYDDQTGKATGSRIGLDLGMSAAVLAKAAEDEPHTPSQWLQRLRHRLRTRVLEDLVARGVVQDVDETQMGVIHVHRYPTTDPAYETAIRRRLAEALTSEGLCDER